jgi:hypothetical protein
MNIVTITVCVDYSDIFEICIKRNISSIKNWFVITSSKDKNTQELCKKYNLYCCITDIFYANNCVFNKAAALNSLLKFLQNKGELNNFDWILSLDADIILNDCLDNFISSSLKNSVHEVIVNNVSKNLNIYDLFYSCQRKIFNTQNDFISNNGYLENIDFIGYFQLFHKSKILNDLQNNQNIFPEFPTACRYDDAFKYKYWPDRKEYAQIRGLVYHLGPIATNWEGRKTGVWDI